MLKWHGELALARFWWPLPMNTARRSAIGVITPIIPMRAPPMVITGQTGLWTASSSAPGLGTTAAGTGAEATADAAGAGVRDTADAAVMADARPLAAGVAALVNVAATAEQRGAELPDGRVWAARLVVLPLPEAAALAVAKREVLAVAGAVVVLVLEATQVVASVAAAVTVAVDTGNL